ncbi:NADH:ubiquinone oxidoreductase intermediate-associated protein 30 [Hibiscus syriacus]|uniref:NADH:ubiquinone oxidoreductase intermediate-associated protein 30 n=1 Tax=Hibiscus syriacus TaxID=106335 RepID=A0A6A3A644_HIBSY|nr:NADH:ubiquinone oxidoreductase intermediate-associated protein 30 [Hibiscus syriacus]
MASGGAKNNDFYAVMGLNKDCTQAELKTSYKKLALRCHPDRCSASANSKFAEEAKKKFQGIQQAYSVLSDANKRFLYDVGVYDSDDDENGMGDFLNEMTEMMLQTKPSEKGEESLEELQELFEEMFEADIDSYEPTSCTASSSCGSYGQSSKSFSESSSGETFDAQVNGFFLGKEQKQGIRQQRRARAGTGRKQKVSWGHDVSSNDYDISAS